MSCYHTLSQRGNDMTDATRTCPELPSCNDMAMICPGPDLLPHDDDDVPWAVPPPQRDSNDGNDDDILVMPTTTPSSPPSCLQHDIMMTTVMCPGPYHHHSMTTPPLQPSNDVEPIHHSSVSHNNVNMPWTVLPPPWDDYDNDTMSPPPPLHPHVNNDDRMVPPK